MPDAQYPIPVGTPGGADVQVADGGTGASTAAGARTNLGLGNVDNTSDANKPVSTSQQTALDLKANLISPVLVTPNLGTPSAGVLTNCTGTAAGLTAGNATTAAALTGLTATVTELNQLNDVSVYQETVVAAGAMSATKVVTKLAVVGGGAVTLAIPDASMYGQQKIIEMTAANGDVTFALTNVVGQSSGTTATFNSVGDALVLLGAFDKWIVIKEFGIALA